MSYCNGYPHLGPDEGLGPLLTGDNGVGKTHLAVSVLRELMSQKGARGQFWDFHELIREIRNSYNPETKTTELMVLEPVVEADVLLLDDGKTRAAIVTLDLLNCPPEMAAALREAVGAATETAIDTAVQPVTQPASAPVVAAITRLAAA